MPVTFLATIKHANSLADKRLWAYEMAASFSAVELPTSKRKKRKKNITRDVK
jgi:hypothetical protein